MPEQYETHLFQGVIVHIKSPELGSGITICIAKWVLNYEAYQTSIFQEGRSYSQSSRVEIIIPAFVECQEVID